MGEIFLIQNYQNGAMVNKMPLGWLIVSLIITIAIPVTFYLLRSIGIYKLAKSHNVKHAFMAWIPFAWVYPLCLLVKEFTFFGYPYGKLALAFCVIFCVYGGLSLVHKILAYLPLVGYFLQGGAVYISTSLKTVTSVVSNAEAFWIEGSGIYLVNVQYPYGNLDLMVDILNRVNDVMSILDLVQIIVLINLYIVLFRKFWPQHYILAAVLSAFGLFDIFVFVIRNRKAMSFEEYVRSRNAGYQSSYNTYDQNTKYEGGRISKKDEPFAEFGDDDEPFSDFFDDKGKK